MAAKREGQNQPDMMRGFALVSWHAFLAAFIPVLSLLFGSLPSHSPLRMGLAAAGELSGQQESTRVAERGRRLRPPWELKGPSSWARVYIDSSGSMQGFIGNQAGSHARLLRRLKDILVDGQVLNFEVVQFGLKVAEPVKVAAFQPFGLDRKRYGEADTYLAGAIEDALSWRRNGVVLILTDGVSSVTKYHGPASGPSARTCALGSDTACLALRIHEYVQAGHGFWIVGFRFPFDGPYWVEEGGPKAIAGARLDRVRVSDRPFYVWVGAPDVAQGRAIVRDLVRFAQTTKPSIATMSIEAAPGPWERWEVPPDASLEEMDVPSQRFCTRGGALLRAFRARASGERFPAMEVAARERGSFAVRLPVQRPEAIEEPKGNDVFPLLQFRQELALSLPKDLSAETVSLNWSLQPYDGAKKGRWRWLDLCLTARPPLAPLGKDIEVTAHWKGERAGKAHTLWDAWSTDTDDTEEAARRTVSLSLFFRHLLSQMLPEFGERAVPFALSETFLRLHYRK